MEYTIRLGTPQDVDELARLYDELNDYLESTVNYPGWRKGIYPARIEAENGVAEQNLFVLCTGGQVAGSVIVNHHPEAAYDTAPWQVQCRQEDTMVIHTLVVHPGHMQKGIGALLLQHAKQYAQSSNMRALRLDVYEKNTPAIHLYQNCGYKYIAKADLGLGEYGLDTFLLYELPL